MFPHVKTKIAVGVVVTVLLSCCGFALWRRLAPNHHASGDKGCYASTAELNQLGMASCDKPHEAELIDFYYPEGADAGCRKAAEEFLGGPLRDARIELQRLSYVRDDFTSLACALVGVSDSDDKPVRHTGSLGGTMGGDRPMAITCGGYNRKVLVYLTCAEPHSAEYVGAVIDGGQPDVSCHKAVADYVGLSVDDVGRRGDLDVRWFDKPRDGGYTGCVVVEAKERDVLTGSVRGLGNAPLPIK
jgi:hypothetical protein